MNKHILSKKGVSKLSDAGFDLEPAIEFPEGLIWLNTDRPIRLSDLHGKVVLLDFWTYA